VQPLPADHPEPPPADTVAADANRDPKVEAEIEAHLAALSADATVAFTGLPGGAVEARQRRPDGGWSSPLTVREPTFTTRADAGVASLPFCTGWCCGCNAASRWRPDPASGPGTSVTRWCCTRCLAGKADNA